MTENVWDGKENSGIIIMTRHRHLYEREVRKDWQNANEVVNITGNIYCKGKTFRFSEGQKMKWIVRNIKCIFERNKVEILREKKLFWDVEKFNVIWKFLTTIPKTDKGICCKNSNGIIWKCKVSKIHSVKVK